LTVGHNLQFTPEMLELRRLISEGFLGGPPVHVESHFSYDLGDASYVRPLLSSGDHWVRKLPGQLLHNIISHGIGKLAEFLDSDLEVVLGDAHQSAKLRAMGGQEVLDELRVLIRDGKNTTAFFCFSTQFQPGLNELRICGKQNSITVNHASGSLIRHINRSNKSYLTYLMPPLRASIEHLRNAKSNLVGIVRRRLFQDAGMKELTGQFYQSIEANSPPPIPYREILLTARIMDDLFLQAYGNNESVKRLAPLEPAV
jgi:predicted dehydrogenase